MRAGAGPNGHARSLSWDGCVGARQGTAVRSPTWRQRAKGASDASDEAEVRQAKSDGGEGGHARDRRHDAAELHACVVGRAHNRGWAFGGGALLDGVMAPLTAPRVYFCSPAGEAASGAALPHSVA